MTPHLKRWLTGILVVPPLFAVLYFGSREVFLILILLLTLGGIAEYIALSFGKGHRVEKAESFAAALIFPIAAFAGGLTALAAWTTVFFISSFIIFLGGLKGETFDIGPLHKIVFGFLYIPLLMAHLILLRNDQNGVLWIFFMITLAFSGDITAFYVGRNIGRKKLMPHVSAGKTVEGTIGSVAGSVAGCLLFKALLFPEIPAVHAAIMGFLGNIIGELGDLCESVIKRQAGAKDSGSVLPGHGGILDRLDCILFVAPFLYYYRLLIMG
jgi:phosphatidate cytidylyltransferase